jgi:acyl-CoA thioesterase-2
VHAQALVYLTDHGATRAIRQPHATHPGVEQRMSVSLDHAVWLHQSVRVDEWLLSEFSPIATGGARGLTTGTIRASDGRLIATVAQEALLRLPASE